MEEPYIHVSIPYFKGNLAKAYNTIIEKTDAEWFLFLDHDVFLGTNNLWYSMCIDAIKQLEKEKVGWITCKTNRIGCRRQLHNEEPSDDILKHILIAKKLYKKYGNQVSQIGKTKLSGFFILTNKTAWKAVGGFRHMGKGMSKIDNDYSVRLRQAGFGLYILEGLYIYHMWKKIKKEVFNW
jgi:GT2 family glycosyltransferase